MAKEDFLTGVLQGLYQGGLGNPEVQENRRSRALQEAYYKRSMDKDAAESGLRPVANSHPETGNVVNSVMNVLFPGRSGLQGAFNTKYEPDPNQPRGYVGPSGELSTSPVEGGSALNPREYKGALLDKGKRDDNQDFRRMLAEMASGNQRGKQSEDRTMKIRDGIMGSDSYKSWLNVKGAMDMLEQTAKDPSAFGSVTAVYEFVKNLDDRSAVKEGEIKLVGEAAGIASRLENSLNTLARGQRLNQGQLTELYDWAKKKERIKRETARKSNDPFIKQAKRLNLNMDEINSDLFGSVEDTRPISEPTAPTKVIGGKTYIKGRDGWYEQ
jgi:hypothetical protein